jgi:hypothetical protein
LQSQSKHQESANDGIASYSFYYMETFISNYSNGFMYAN